MVRVGVDLKRRDFVWIGLIVVLLCVGFVVAQWDSAKAMFHDSEDVKITIGGVDYSLQNASDLGLLGGGGIILREGLSQYDHGKYTTHSESSDMVGSASSPYWVEWDVSHIVPADAKAVQVNFYWKNNDGAALWFRSKDHPYNLKTMWVAVSGREYYDTAVFALGNNKVLEYELTGDNWEGGATYDEIGVTITGWWIG